MKATSTTYEFSLDEVKKVIAKELGVEESKARIEVVEVERGDDRFGSTSKEVTGLKITIKS